MRFLVRRSTVLFFQAEDGIRDLTVTGVQTCALPILLLLWRRDVVERLQRLAPFAAFDAPVPPLAEGTLWWGTYGYLESEAVPLVRRAEGQRRPGRHVRAGLLGTLSAASGEPERPRLNSRH